MAYSFCKMSAGGSGVLGHDTLVSATIMISDRKLTLTTAVIVTLGTRDVANIGVIAAACRT